ncbi:hypothetical protein [Lactobacillus sp. ESL0681]|uniref:hypothetical protein n=1 Tax=Lactobacillus sp. ESL0681 TaxID=2983211 RepID=UPI0023F75986|nr:hypothetical protein [Lactobacillus sp. ESL0681]WEV40124.1 hypothetical protein OZX59_07920 [Lactobacillus sp. ESL0681]
MSNFKIQTFINDEEVKPAVLERLKYERSLHVLHELMDLGVKIKDNSGNDLDKVSVNWLEPEVAIATAVKAHSELGSQGTLDLYHDILLDSDKHWHEYNEVPIEEQGCQTATTHLVVSGVDIQSFGQGINNVTGGDLAFKINPEHYYVNGELSTGKQEIMETFGMFGEPTLTYGKPAKEIPDYYPVKRLEDHPMCMAGETYLVHDDFNLHVGAVHQIKPLPDGIDIVSTFVCPNNAPKAIAQGHTVHFALELGGMLTLLHDSQAK